MSAVTEPPFETFALNNAPAATSLNALLQGARDTDQTFELYPARRIQNLTDAFADLWHLPGQRKPSTNFKPGPLHSAPVVLRSMTEALVHPATGLVFDSTGRVMLDSLEAERSRDPSWTTIAPVVQEGRSLAPVTTPILDGPVPLYTNHGGYTVFAHAAFETLPLALIFAQLLRAGQMTLLTPPIKKDVSHGLVARLLSLIALPGTVQTQYPDAYVRQRGLIVASTISGRNTFAPGQMQRDLGRTVKATIPSARGRRRLFLTRFGEATTQRRDLINESDLLAALQPMGFEAVNPGLLPPREQVELFASAECLVSVMGSVWANLIYTEPGTLVVDLLPEHKAAVEDPFGINTAKAMMLPYILILTPSTGTRANNIDVFADVPLVADRVRRGLARVKEMGLR